MYVAMSWLKPPNRPNRYRLFGSITSTKCKRTCTVRVRKPSADPRSLEHANMCSGGGRRFSTSAVPTRPRNFPHRLTHAKGRRRSRRSRPGERALESSRRRLGGSGRGLGHCSLRRLELERGVEVEFLPRLEGGQERLAVLLRFKLGRRWGKKGGVRSGGGTQCSRLQINQSINTKLSRRSTLTPLCYKQNKQIQSA